MVNGLAPPGTRSLDEMEEWGCARCGTMNGVRKQRAAVAEKKYEEKESMLESSISDLEPRPKHRASSATRKVKTENSGSDSEEVSE
jgi:hypothetical protein